jgi:hypothetical protein
MASWIERPGSWGDNIMEVFYSILYAYSFPFYSASLNIYKISEFTYLNLFCAICSYNLCMYTDIQVFFFFFLASDVYHFDVRIVKRFMKITLTFIIQTFKLPTALHGQTLNDPKSLNMQTFRKTAFFPFYAT